MNISACKKYTKYNIRSTQNILPMKNMPMVYTKRIRRTSYFV